MVFSSIFMRYLSVFLSCRAADIPNFSTVGGTFLAPALISSF